MNFVVRVENLRSPFYVIVNPLKSWTPSQGTPREKKSSRERWPTYRVKCLHYRYVTTPFSIVMHYFLERKGSIYISVCATSVVQGTATKWSLCLLLISFTFAKSNIYNCHQYRHCQLLTFRTCLLKMYRIHVQIFEANISVRLSISFIVLLPHIRLDSLGLGLFLVGRWIC